MQVAIMGAGLSGLACAITLERSGVKPVIFESRKRVGDRFINGEILLSALHRPCRDVIAYFSDQYQIDLKPTANIRTMVVHSENEKAVIRGDLGFSNIRGRHEHSFENQLAGQVQGKITFNSHHSYEDLAHDFSHVILATGDPSFTERIQSFQNDLTVSLYGATVKGQFDRFTVMTWLDYRLAPQGYAYCIPFSEEEANIVIAYPDYPENRETGSEEYFRRFHERARRDLDQPLPVTDHFQVTRYMIGNGQYPRIGNTFFVGNCLNSLTPFLGFGQFAAVLSGIYAAQDLLGEGSYEQLVRPLCANYQNSLVLRRILEQMDNARLDALVRRLHGFWGQKIFNNPRYDLLKLASYILRPLAKRSMHTV